MTFTNEQSVTELEIELKPRPVLPRYSKKQTVRRKQRLTKIWRDKPNYGEKIRWAVRLKWPTSEMKEWWYILHSAARKRKTILLYEKQEGKCIFCGHDTWLFESHRNGASLRRKATIDHVKPQSSGGTDNLRNLVMACMGCNTLRQNMAFEKFVELRSDQTKWAAYCKARAREKTKKPKELSDKKQLARLEFIGKMATFMFYFPEHGAYLRQMVAERIRKQAEHNQKRKENSMIDPTDLIKNDMKSVSP
jgi:5-methylcytosine-specific restriction endonuclease McrA